jgi:hypothetical protein
MTDKYTVEYVKSMISTSDIDYITELMNCAYKEGFKDGQMTECKSTDELMRELNDEHHDWVKLTEENEKLKKENEILEDQYKMVYAEIKILNKKDDRYKKIENDNEHLNKIYIALAETLANTRKENENLKEELLNASGLGWNEFAKSLKEENERMKKSLDHSEKMSGIDTREYIGLKQENDLLREDLDKAKECIMLYRSYMEKSTSELKEFNSRFLGSNQHQSQ